jgi:hypothetical protein
MAKYNVDLTTEDGVLLLQETIDTEDLQWDSALTSQELGHQIIKECQKQRAREALTHGPKHIIHEPYYDVTQAIMDYEDFSLDHDEQLKLFQNLVSSGLAWKLQGSYGITARALIERGLINKA